MKISRPVRTAAIAALAALVVSDVRADEDAPAPIVTATVSVASYDKVKELSDLVGMPLPPGLTPDGIERALPFIGVGKFRVDAPLGMAFLFGKNLNPEQQGFFVLPMMAGGAPLTDIPDATTTDSPDTIVAGNGMPFRRTADYLMFGGTVPTTSKYDTAKITDLYKTKKTRDGQTVTPLFRCDVDVKGMKSVDPEKLNDFVDKNAGDDARAPDQKKGAEWARSYMKTGVDRFDLDVDQIGDDHLSVSARVAPLHMDSPSVDKPGLPEDCLLRADFRISANVLRQLRAKFAGPEDRKPQDESLVRLISAIYLGSSETIGLESDGEDGAAYEIVQNPEKTDIAKCIHDFVDDWNKAVAKDASIGGKIELENYKSADGTDVQRMKTHGFKGDSSTLYLDTCAVDKTVFLAIGSNKKHLVEHLIGLKSAGKFDSVASGWIKPRQSSKLLQKMADQQKIPPELLSVIAQMGEDPLQWHADNEGDGIRFTVEFPREILRNLGPALGAGN